MQWLYLLLGVFTFVELNCENLFDTQHDSLKQDMEYLPESYHHWNKSRYWNKLNHIGQSIIACGKHENKWLLPDLVALCEVENDSVVRDLTKRPSHLTCVALMLHCFIHLFHLSCCAGIASV